MHKHEYQILGEELQLTDSPRIAFRPVCRADVGPLFDATRDPTFNAVLSWDAPATEAELAHRIRAILHAVEVGYMTAASAIDRRTGEWLGLCRFMPYEPDTSGVELAVWMHGRVCRNPESPLVLELGRLCLDAVFDVTQAPFLVGAAVPLNMATTNLFRSSGMKERGYVKRMREDGETLKVREFRITRSEWEGLHRRHETLNEPPPGRGNDVDRYRSP